MNSKQSAAAAIFGVSLIVGIIRELSTGNFNYYSFVGAMTYAVLAALIPIGLGYLNKIRSAYVAAGIINFLFLSYAFTPSVAGATMAAIYVFGIGYCVYRFAFIPIRNAIRRHLQKQAEIRSND